MVFPLNSLGRQVLQRYGGASIGTRIFLNMRWRWTPYEEIAAHVPKVGTVLDLGAGHGLLSLAMALLEPGRKVIGIDHAPARIALASQAAADVANIAYTTGGLLDAVQGETVRQPVSAIVIMDAIHYLDYADQEALLTRALGVLQPGGALLIRDVDAAAGKNFFINRMHEKIMTGLGFTRGDKLNFRRQQEWHDLLRGIGYECECKPCSRFPFADLLFVCRRPAMQAAMAA